MNNIKKAITGFAALALVATLFPAGAGAQTTADLQAQIAALLAQVNALTAQLNASGGATVTTTFTRDLTLGSTGADVQALQRFLNANGYVIASIGAGSPGNETMYFGGLTKAALARYQAAKNISPAVGYFGPITRTAVNAQINATTGGTGTGTNPGTTPTTPTTPTLNGGAGSINDADWVAGLNNEEVGEDEEDVEVAGLEIETDEGSDIMITAVRLVFVHTSMGAGSDDDFEDYADEVSLWFEGDEVARVDADEFDDDNDYSRTISLDEDVIIRMDDMGELIVAVTGIGNLDSDNEGETWTVEFDSVRFQDAQGAVISDTSTGDIGATRTFSFDSFASASDVELEAVETGDNPDGQIVEADDSSDTNNVLLLAGELRNNGDSEIEIKELTVNITPAGTGDASEIASSYILVIDGDEVQSVNSDECETAGDCDGTGTATAVDYVFDDVDFMLDGGESVDFEIRADINEVDGTIVMEGDSLTAQVDADDIDAEDESGEDLGTADLKGVVSGNEQVFYTIFPEITLVGTPMISYVGDSTNTANVSFEIRVRAVGGTIYLNGDDEATAAKEAFQASVLGGDGNTTLSALVYTTTGTYTTVNPGADNEYFRITSGNSMTFKLSGSLSQATTTVPAGAEIDEILFGTASTDDTSRSAFSVDFEDLTDELETALLTLIGV